MNEFTKDNFVAFFYILMRDELPVGKVIEIINDLKGNAPYSFTNETLTMLATKLVERLEVNE